MKYWIKTRKIINFLFKIKKTIYLKTFSFLHFYENVNYNIKLKKIIKFS